MVGLFLTMASFFGVTVPQCALSAVPAHRVHGLDRARSFLAEDDAPCDGSGNGLPVSHSHLWFADDLDNHTTLTRDPREAIADSGRYPYGGG